MRRAGFQGVGVSKPIGGPLSVLRARSNERCIRSKLESSKLDLLPLLARISHRR